MRFPRALEDIIFADQHAAHGNFRAWSQLTAHTRTALTRTGSRLA
ncbi:hypothetical protein ACWDRX_31495 [Streptomyces nigra]